MRAPFEGILGNNCALRTIEFLLPLYGIEYNISELADQVNVSRQSMSRILSTFEGWGMLNTRNYGASTLYSINEKSPLVSSILLFNSLVTEKMFESEVPKISVIRGAMPREGLIAQIPETSIYPFESNEPNATASGSWSFETDETTDQSMLCEV